MHLVLFWPISSLFSKGFDRLAGVSLTSTLVTPLARPKAAKDEVKQVRRAQIRLSASIYLRFCKTCNEWVTSACFPIKLGRCRYCDFLWIRFWEREVWVWPTRLPPSDGLSEDNLGRHCALTMVTVPSDEHFRPMLCCELSRIGSSQNPFSTFKFF